MAKILKSNPLYQPWHAGKMAARYMPADPQAWLNAAVACGMFVELAGDRIWFFDNDAPNDEVVFLQTWLRETPGGKKALKALLKRRGLAH